MSDLEKLTLEDMREKQTDELENLEADLRRALWKSRFDNFTNQLDDTARIKKLRRGVARAKTLLTQREQAERKQAEQAAKA